MVRDFLRRVYEEEVTALVEFARRHKMWCFALVVACLLVALLLKYPALFWTLAVTFRDRYTPLWLAVVLAAWLLALTYYVHSARKQTEISEFRENFRHGLEDWEYYGGWRTERDGRQRILTVTESAEGGIARPCLLWRDYEFEFETKIVRGNTTWLVRARDILNYVMLQCGRSELNPHFRANGFWLLLDHVPLPLTLPTNTWFFVRIRVQGTRVTVSVRLGDAETEIYNSELLRPEVKTYTISADGETRRTDLMLSYPTGSVGFREWGETECAQFRNVRVKKIQ